jgi:hypothetical protein
VTRLKGPSPTQHADPDDRFSHIAGQILARRDLFARCGTVLAKFRRRAGRRVGPYYYVSYRDGGRHRSIYLGKCPELAEKVRALLAEIQEPERRRRQARRRRRQLVSELRAQKARWHQDLRARGLYTRGYVVHGWRRLKLARRAAKLAARLGIPCTTKP